MTSRLPAAARRAVRRFLRGLAAVLAVVVVVSTVRLWGGGVGPPGELARDVEAQLTRLDAAIERGAAEDAQRWFPEGYAFTHLLVALAGIDAALQRPDLAEAAVDRARAALVALDGPAGRAPFPDLPPDGAGAFHASWSAYLAAGLVLVQGAEVAERDLADLARRCGSLADLVATSPTPFPPSYVDQAWPVDVLPGLVALRVCERHDLGDHGEVVATATVAVATSIGANDGLLPHRTDAATGATVEGPRATSSSLAQRFLVDLDPTLARDVWTRCRDTFVGGRLSLPAVLEFPDGRWTGGDVDSGPLVAGISASAAVVTMGAARVSGDQDTADQLHRAGEAFGLPVRVGGRSTYALGVMPVGEAFLLWSKTATPWLEEVPATDRAPVVPRWWRVPWTLLGLLVGAVLATAALAPEFLRRHAGS